MTESGHIGLDTSGSGSHLVHSFLPHTHMELCVSVLISLLVYLIFLGGGDFTPDGLFIHVSTVTGVFV